MAEFHPPDWRLPLALEARLAAVPADAQVKGLFFATARRVAQEHAGRAPGRESYSALINYPPQELVTVLAECAALAFPDLPPREGLRRLGHVVFPAVRENAAGTFLFSVAGNTLASAIRLIGRAYALFSTARATLVANEANRALVELRNAWTFPDSYHLGILEGAMRFYHANGEIRLANESYSGADLELRWS